MKRILFSLVLGSMLTTFCFAEKKSSSSVNAKMRNLQNTLLEVLPIVISDQQFSRKKNLEKFKRATQRFASMAHEIDIEKLKKKNSKIDPSIQMIANLFSQEASRAYEEVKSGRYTYARRLVQGLTNYCFHCHTSSGLGPRFNAVPNKKHLKKLSQYEKANYLAAIRNFDGAINEYESLLNNIGYVKGRKIEWENSARKALAISVRVKNDPVLSGNIVDRALNAKYISEFFREDLVEWKKTILEWKKEYKRTPKTEQGLRAEMKLMFAKAMQKQKYSLDRSADIFYLRGTSVAHQLMKQYPDGKHVSDALYFLGVGYESLKSLGLWYLGELYFEACITKSPKTPIATQCYRRLEESIHMGYSGSGGVSIPSSVERRLQKLKKMIKS